MKYLRIHLLLLVPMLAIAIYLLVHSIQNGFYFNPWTIIGILLNLAVFCFTTAHYISEVRKN